MADPGINCVVRTEVLYEKPIFHLMRDASDISHSTAQRHLLLYTRHTLLASFSQQDLINQGHH